MPSPSSGPPWSQIAESVTPGHPDKVADQISDAVLDAYLAADPYARVNCEVMVTRDHVLVTGQVTAAGAVDVEAVARGVLSDVGYRDVAVHGIDAARSPVTVVLDHQSREIGSGVDEGGSGDSGVVYGYACDETPELLPLSCVLAHGLTRALAEERLRSPDSGLGPDGKVQVEVAGGDRSPRGRVVLSVQHAAGRPLDAVREFCAEQVVGPVLAARDLPVEWAEVNPAGSFVVGGTAADAGLTGRKLMVDTYGGLARHGGGCFSGKDATKVDRSGAYVARQLALTAVAAGLAARCQVGMAYAIGRPEPVWFEVDCSGTERVDPAKLTSALRSLTDLRVDATISRLRLRHTSFRPTATFGHFGRTGGLPWEQPVRADELRAQTS
ncbi:putative S-adenosylmethionine synthetase [Actinacidiphila reveromycinica]|uniref:Methionine adenosyltransferase n=1 Tax=Actinacidiphila reveromycinica TaxID=659352 RepID=A0A7U3UZV8_9ACTN|nr:methionine adenosyltransferase [Streptomyces sp. SN-593]BBB01891.1 putative S-adenosylmethionine synthetase [Streptomyces sp. SN-593]